MTEFDIDFGKMLTLLIQNREYLPSPLCFLIFLTKALPPLLLIHRYLILFEVIANGLFFLFSSSSLFAYWNTADYSKLILLSLYCLIIYNLIGLPLSKFGLILDSYLIVSNTLLSSGESKQTSSMFN